MKERYGKKLESRYTDSKLSGHFGRKMLKKEKSEHQREEEAGLKFLKLNHELNQVEKIRYLGTLSSERFIFSVGI